MERLWDEALNVALREALGPAVPALEMLTHLGDGALLVAVAVLIYWFGDRQSDRERVFVIAIGIAALALSAGVKGIVQLPRPALAFSPAYYPGYSFPSAHVVGAAAFYGALAVTIRVGRAWQRYLAVAAIVLVVALSRVVIGVHYVGDTIVGALLGFGLVWLGLRWRRGGEFEPWSIFLVAALIAGVSVLLGSRVFVTLSIGAAIGGGAGWLMVRDRETSDNGAAILVIGVVALAALLWVRALSLWLASMGMATPPTPAILAAEILAFAGLTGLVIYLPALAVRIEDDPLVRRVQRRLPLAGRRVRLD